MLLLINPSLTTPMPFEQTYEEVLNIGETNTKFAGVNQGAHSHVGSLVNSSVSGPGMAV